MPGGKITESRSLTRKRTQDITTITTVDDPRKVQPASLRVLWVNWTNAVPSPTDPTALPAQPASLTHTAKP